MPGIQNCYIREGFQTIGARNYLVARDTVCSYYTKVDGGLVTVLFVPVIHFFADKKMNIP